MCGIAGVIGEGVGDEGRVLLERAVSLMAHRGPDAHQIWAGDGAALGFVRLAILDLTDCAMQPMSTEESCDLHLVFNGEIYNYVELAEQLRAAGHMIRSSGDSEVILHAYEEWGRDCVTRFNGMWGLAVWDARRRELFCSRDRFGVKPFYFARTRFGFAFASEIKALISIDPTLAEPDEGAIYRFLSSGLLDESDATFFRRIRQLPASHNMIVRADGSWTLERYYDTPAAVLATGVPADMTGHFRELITDAVRLRLRSDVPVGTCLSGGLDSSTIVGLADTLMPERVSSFTSSYPGTDADEGAYARAAAERYQTDAHWTEPSKDDFFDVLPSIVWHQDEPTSAPGLYSQWHVMKLAHGNVKVLLDGQGGDEILAGYLGYYGPYAASLVKHGRLGELAREYGEIRTQLGGEDPVKAAALARAPEWAKRAYRRVRRLAPEEQQLLDPSFAAAQAPAAPPPVKPDALPDPLNASLVDSLTRSSIPALLHYEDRNSMAFSIEARTPFLDYRLVEFCLALPAECKIRGWETKVVLREAMADILPPEILARRDKKGYPTPLALWLRAGLMPKTREILLSPEARGRGILNPLRIEAILDEHEAGRADHHWEIWRLLTLELWFRGFIDGFGTVTL